MAEGEAADAAVIGSPEERERRRGSAYGWIALSTTTLGVLLVAMNASLVLTALPDISRGIGLDPLSPGNSGYLLWLILGFLVPPAVLLVSCARLGDRYGHARLQTAGFALFTVSSGLLSVTWMSGSTGAIWLVVLRVLQGVGGALLLANSRGILAYASPAHRRELVPTSRILAATTGVFLGLFAGGLLAPVNWRLVFLASVPLGLIGTALARTLQDAGERRRERIGWWGTLTLAVGVLLVLLGMTYGVQSFGEQPTGWSNPLVVAAILGGLAVLIAFVAVEARVAEPMFRLPRFRNRAFTADGVAGLLSVLGVGGLLLVLVLWLLAIWLPLHGHSSDSAPLWAAICLLPLGIGFLAAAPISGYLSRHFGVRPFTTGGMLVAALAFVFLLLLPVNFSYGAFAAILLLTGIGLGLFTGPNRVGGGMAAMVQNSAQVLSTGVFFGLTILGLAATLSGTLVSGLTEAGVPVADAQRVAELPPVATLFASLLGDNPIEELLGPAVTTLDTPQLEYVTGRQFFPSLIAGPFEDGLHVAFDFAVVACLSAAAASSLRGGEYLDAEGAGPGSAATATVTGPTFDRPTAAFPTGADAPDPSPEPPLPAPPAAAEVASGELVGTVRDSEGRLVPGAVLTLTRPGDRELARATTDHAGRFSIVAGEADPAQDFVLVVSGSTIDPVARVLRLDDEVHSGAIELEAPSSLGMVEGRLVRSDAPGEPVPDGTVVLTERGMPVARARTDAAGSFVLDEVPAGEHVLTAVAPNGQPRSALLRLRPHERVRRDIAVPAAPPARTEDGAAQPVDT